MTTQPSRIPQQQEPANVGGRPVAQEGNRVRVTCGGHQGRTGLVVGIHLARDGQRVHRRPIVLLDEDPDRQQGVKLRTFTDGQLCILD